MLMNNYNSHDHLTSSKKIAKLNNLGEMFASSSKLDDTRHCEVDLTSSRLEDTRNHEVVLVSDELKSESESESDDGDSSQVTNRSHKIVHPLFDEVFYLDDDHKMRLKKEFNMDALSFNQIIGEAVIIPAGCPYQMKKIKLCVNVVYEFMSPESALEGVKVIDAVNN
ncbi:hypothetical protein L1987_38422 [Smallanthus sonchifolius]|uniref:Uncharacterized protein n=1 Tax=Smallanthus sonchifolius TaxID=185202 RepID=A0ACB9HIY4_9ASTR|nr:hypothetical protein L1987_38422 [Smallanthus sonchifolius]